MATPSAPFPDAEPGPDRDAVSGPPRCSAKGCRAPATVDLQWRNPKIHDETRVKHWLACDEHADHLAQYLSLRNFLLARGPFEPPVEPSG